MQYAKVSKVIIKPEKRVDKALGSRATIRAAQSGDRVTKVTCGGDDPEQRATCECGCVAGSKILGVMTFCRAKPMISLNPLNSL